MPMGRRGCSVLLPPQQVHAHGAHREQREQPASLTPKEDSYQLYLLTSTKLPQADQALL